MPSHESSVDIDGQDSATHESPGGARSSARRHQVSAACLACQKRKSKCDGIKPLCATCVKRNTTCLYLEYGRSRADMRRTIESLNVENNNFRLFVQELREAPDEQVADIIERLRTDRKPLNNPELHEIAAQSVSGVRAAQSGNSAVTKRDVGRQQVKEVGSEEMLLGNLLLNLQSTNLPETSLRPQPSALASPVSSLSPATMLLSNLELEYRKDSGAGLRSDGTSPQSSVEDWIRGGQSSLRPLILKQIAAGFGSLSPQIDGIDGINGTDVVRWTQVTSDADAIGHLLDIYFTWHHPLMQAFSEVSFRQDMQQGHTKHCSRILVNAILALACTLMDASGSEHNVYSANKFMEEASTLYARNAQPCMTTAIALALMALFESVQYQRKAAWDYAQDAAQMALQLSLHMKTTYMHGPSAEDGNTGSLALWAVFQADLYTIPWSHLSNVTD
ncbi:hypothetical protein MMC25_005855 [Agyrium rufum]|nr:hypothetical protein [Agyrium rufum]